MLTEAYEAASTREDGVVAKFHGGQVTDVGLHNLSPTVRWDTSQSVKIWRHRSFIANDEIHIRPDA